MISVVVPFCARVDVMITVRFLLIAALLLWCAPPAAAAARGSGPVPTARTAARPTPGPSGTAAPRTGADGAVALGTGASGAGAAGAAASGAGVGRAWPVGLRPAVLRGWEPPASVYGPGHRGVDLAAAPGSPVRAAASGRVSFAGKVAGVGALSVTLAGTGTPPLRTTYEPVEPLVAEGEEVSAGQVVARLAAGPFHCAGGCLHWGLLRGKAYLDPLTLLPPRLLRRGPSRLLPLP
jgi:murein DD-endopeptidase MepM/ murein hydrolase activator NlpD